MKARLPFFLLALLTGSCFFPGSVKANPSPTDIEVRDKTLDANVLGHRLAGGQFAIFPFFTEAAFLSTDTHTGNEKAGAHAEPVEVAAPVVENPIPAQTATEGTAFSFAFAENTFSDADGDVLSYTASLTDGSNLPAWLSFDGATRTFSGTPAATDVGVVNIRVTATDPGGETAIADFDLTVNSANVAPTVNAGTDQTITLPANTTSFTATAEDTDGTIATYAWTTADSPAGSTVTLAGAETNTLDVTVDLEGTYTFKVTVTDNDGATASDQVSLTVNPEPAGNVAPEVSITSPANGESFPAPANITITANASDADGTVAKVAFYKDTELLGEDTNAGDGWSFIWTDVAAGAYSLTAIATDGLGATTTSTAVEIAVTGENASPTVSITSPTDGATFTAPANITISADASDTDGEVTKVVFFKGTEEIGTDVDGTDGWSFLWTDVAAGTYVLTAIATDDLGATTTSPEVNIEVKGPNTDPVVSITSPADGATFTAPADITITADASDPDADGAVAKVEFFKGADKLGEDIDRTDGWSYRWSGVAGGSYTLTAIATDNLGATATSAEVNIAVEGPNTDPVVSITSPADGERFTAPADITITADASDPDADGTVAKVEFFQGETNLGEDLTSPYSFTWSGVAAGTYALTAIATDNLGATTTSSVINITVSDPLGIPVSIVPGSTCGPGTVTLSAEPGSGGDAVRWYDASVDGTPLDTTATGESYTTEVITITTSYWIATFNTSTLEESERVEIVATVKDVPPAPTVTAADNCDGTSNLTASDYTGSLLWSTGETTETITVTTAGEYTVTQTVDGCTSAAGAGTAAPKSPPAEPEITNIQSSYYTSDPPVTLTGDPTGGSFTLNGTAFDGVFDPCTVGAGTHTVRYTVTNADGCSNFKEYEVTVVQATYTVIITAEPFPICKGQKTKYTAHVYKNAEVVYPYLEDPALITQENPATTYNPAYDPYLPAETDSIHKLYPARFFQPVVLSGELMPTENFSYQWTKNEKQNISKNSEIFEQAGLSSTDYYKVYVTEKSNDGCVTTITDQLSNPMFISEPDGYTIEISSEPTTICKGEDVTFTATLGDGFNWSIANLKMSWYLERNGTPYLIKEVSGIADLQLSSSEINIALTNLGVSPAELVDGDKVYVEFETDLESILPADSKCKARQRSLNPVTITVNDLSAEAGSSQEICENGSATFTVSATATGTAAVSYQWYFNGDTINGATASSLTIENAQLSDEGTYSAVATNGCQVIGPLDAGTLTITPLTVVSEATLEVTWINGDTQWEVKADEAVEGEFGDNPTFTWYRRVSPYEDWGGPVQTGPDSIYIENAPEEEPEFKAEIMNSETCTLYELTNIGVTAQPVEMIYFRAEEQGEDVRLSWATATERYNTGFEVQLSTDGQAFRKLAFVETLNGNSLEVQEYAYTDREPGKQGIRYYRLQQIDVDGTTAYFGPIMLALRNTGSVKVYPNPFLDRLLLSIESEKAGQALLSVANNTGTIVLKQSLLLQKGTNSAEILLDPHLPAGIYFVSTRIGGKTRHFKLFKQ